MVRIAASFIGAAVAFASLVSAAPAKRQETVGDLNTIGLDGIPSADPNGTLGGTVDIPSVTEPAPYETQPAAPYETEPASPYEPEPVSPYEPEAPPPYEPAPPVHTPETLPPAHQTEPQYGSGSVNWETDYNDCVQQCFEDHPAPPTVVTLPPHDGAVVPPAEGDATPPAENGAETVPNVGSTGVTHEIMVEPIDGALHFGPGFVTANIGDAIRFTFVKGEHSVVQSSVAFPCNQTVGGFDSGIQMMGGNFTHIVDTLNTTFFYSSVGNDCQNGMFGAINMPTGAPESTTTVSSLLPQWAAANPDLKAALDATNKLAAQTGGMTWGGKLETKDFPAELYPQFASSVLYTRGMIAGNPEMVGTDGVFRITGDVVIPSDINVLLAVADRGGLPTPESEREDVQASAPAPAPVGDAAQNVAQNPEFNSYATGGAGSTVASRFLVGGVALLAALLAF